MTTPTHDEVLRLLLDTAPLVSAPHAVTHAPDVPGLYAIYVDRVDALSPPFRAMLESRRTTLIYLGKASHSLSRRLGQEELRHRRAATFFRSLGAVLGYRPPPGSLAHRKNQRNYRFSDADTAAIIAWLDAHLQVRWVALPRAETEAYEPRLIAALCPLLNLKDNPAPQPELIALRDTCRRIASGTLSG
jgi:hypothetical protein